MTNVWLDANILIRFITRDEPRQAGHAEALMRRAARGDIQLRVSDVAIAETVWVLGSVYRYGRSAIATTLRELALADGIALDDRDVVLEALRLMADANVAYADAHLAALARAAREPVATFDRDVQRLGVELFT